MQKNERRKTQANISPLLLSKQWLENSLMPSLMLEANTYSSLFPSSITTYTRQSNKYTEWKNENGEVYKVTDDGEILDKDFESEDSDLESEEDNDTIIEEDPNNLNDDNINTNNKLKSPSISARKFSINPPFNDRRRSSISPRLSQFNLLNQTTNINSNIHTNIANKLKKKLNTTSILPDFILSPEKLSNKNFSPLDFLKLSPNYIFTPPTYTGIVSIENSSSSSSNSNNNTSQTAAVFSNNFPPPPSINPEQIYRSLYIHCSALLELIDEAKKLDLYEKMLKDYQNQQKIYENKQETTSSNNNNTSTNEFNLPLHTRISECIFRILLYHQENLHEEYFLPPNYFENQSNNTVLEEKINNDKESQSRRSSMSINNTNTPENSLIMRSNYSSSRRGSRRLSSFSNPSFQSNLATIVDSNLETNEDSTDSLESINQQPQLQTTQNFCEIINENNNINNTNNNTTNSLIINNNSFFYNNFINNPPPLLNYHHVLFLSHLHDKYYQKQQRYLIEQEKKLKKLEKEVILTKHQLSIARISTSSLNYQNNLLLLTHDEKIKSYNKKIKNLEDRNRILENECEKWRLLFQGGHNEVDTRGDLILRPGVKDSSNNSIIMMTKMLMMTMNNIMNSLTRSIINYKKRISEEDSIVKNLTKENTNNEVINLDSSLNNSSQAFPPFGIQESFNVEKHSATDIILESMSSSMESVMLLSNRLMEIVEETNLFKQHTDIQSSNITSLKTKLKITLDKKEDVEYENNLLKSKMLKLMTYIEKSDNIVNKINFSKYNSEDKNLIDNEIHDILAEVMVGNDQMFTYFSINNINEKENEASKKGGTLCDDQVVEINLDKNLQDEKGEGEEDAGEGVFTTTDTKYLDENNEETVDIENEEEIKGEGSIQDIYEKLRELIEQQEDDQLINLFKALMETVLNKIINLEDIMNNRVTNLKFALKDLFSLLHNKFFNIMKVFKDKLDIVENNLLISKRNEENLMSVLLTLINNEENYQKLLNSNINITDYQLNEFSEEIENEIDQELRVSSEHISQLDENNSEINKYAIHIENFIGTFEKWSNWKSSQLVDYSTIIYSNSYHNFSSFTKKKFYKLIDIKQWLLSRHSHLLNSLVRIDTLNQYSNTLLLTCGKLSDQFHSLKDEYEELGYYYELLSYKYKSYRDEVFDKVDLINLKNRQDHLDLIRIKKSHEIISNRYYMLMEDFPYYEEFKDYTINIRLHPEHKPELLEYLNSLFKDIEEKNDKIEELDSFIGYLKNQSANQNEIEDKLETEVKALKQENEKLKASLSKLSKKKSSKTSEKSLSSTISTPTLASNTTSNTTVSVSQSTSSLAVNEVTPVLKNDRQDSEPKETQSKILIEPLSSQGAIVNSNISKSIKENKSGEKELIRDVIETEITSNIESPTNITQILNHNNIQEQTSDLPSQVKQTIPFQSFPHIQYQNQFQETPPQIQAQPQGQDPAPQSIPVQSIPVQSIPVQSIPVQSNPMQYNLNELELQSNQVQRQPIQPQISNAVNTQTSQLQPIKEDKIINDNNNEIEEEDEDKESEEIDNNDQPNSSDEDEGESEKVLKLTMEIKSLKLFFSKERLRLIKFYEDEIKKLNEKLQAKDLLILHKS